jgi:hypothetical protein
MLPNLNTMKKKIFIPLLGILMLPLISWGPEGHSTTAQIAENHLTLKAKARVTAILGGRSMSSVSSWADQVKDDDTRKWHFLNLPPGYNYIDFCQATQTQSAPNIYSALKKAISDLATGISAEQKQVDLKYIIHLVGDAHQPMHVSRAKDEGGNLIKLTYNGQLTNLHSLWDGLMIKQDESDYRILTQKLDHASADQIAAWQGDDILKWLYESYQISTKLYSEVHRNDKLGNDYYNKHIKIVEDRITKGGIRLAGVLNKIFK